MASVFKLPWNILSNLTDTSELVPGNAPYQEKLPVVGGKFVDNHERIVDFFKKNVTDTSHHELLLAMVTQLYTIVPVLIILFCQIGFAMVQSGASGAESAAMPFVVNFLTFVTSGLSFWGIGFALARSDGLTVIGYNQWFSHELELEQSVDWLLYFSLTLTAANIANYGGLERCPLLIYGCLAPVVSGVINGISFRWGWHHQSWTAIYTPFKGIAYKDLGGSGMIHVVGGSCALMMSLILGPRYNRIRDRTTKILFNDVDGHSLPLEMFGWYVVGICIMCCNCVRLTATCITCKSTINSVALAISNSVLSASTACLCTLLFLHLIKKFMGKHRFHFLISRQITNGVLIGMVSVAAGCDIYTHWASFVVGVTSSIGYIVWCISMYYAKVDDPAGAVAVHLGGGLWGLVCIHIFREKTGLFFTAQTTVACLALVWNLIIGLTLGALSAAITAVVVMIPKGYGLIPISYRQELQGVDDAFVGQQAYPSGSKVTPFTTDVLEDREDFVDSFPGTPRTVTSPLAFSFSGITPADFGLPAVNDITHPYTSLEVDTKFMPSIVRSPGDMDRRVWFNTDLGRENGAPLTPIIDYNNRSQTFDEMFC